ncbi:phosphoglycerate mutase family protein, putative [Entamoeba histolytica HM-1:IMSS-B]|uniref:Phosphoglycerate mutase family protein n=6 Tax=Entamoeba histolytica TaxID=5759 RepID=C4LVK9_ENTH1|nr:phosphoglycerate mutase family protein [Entamoeba histolytica HM-1:IMSS]EMD48560.1 phosphoglycerate mutase family protein [Entamoeba histolytica KU27]EMH76619.1 phosphoglycerate mutase family protein, putative [Entamoeba histolytica HM-1:IMSS-B]EMS14090.1 phosphoglycerate mutase family protein [Entamoeba histolytica HM-3:IMSS]ENY60548.1 phosphoglycerate mutase family protein, putative [Entamoeba histolytica HM-1:IMSS-A]GAT92706.1 phosphoglycerate mutase family protein putative [Entamoeba hi|eukprot:XP_649053.1 phosphoglycerate mutase family protein [Entamoeba histolytica HM-1:IMSS]
MKTLFIVRHGQTPLNKQKLIHGRKYLPQCPLNEEGVQQAERFYSSYQNLPISTIFTSSLLRSQLSVQHFIEKYPHQILKGFDEVDFGKYEGLTIFENGKCRLDEVFDQWKKGNYDARIEGGQSLNDVVQQQKEAMKIVLETEGNVLIAMHRRALVILLCWTLDIPYSKASEINPKNLELFTLQYNYESQKFIGTKDYLIRD